VTRTEPKVLLHVGMGKTGSTALQVAFVRNRELMAGHGYTYPPHGMDAVALLDGVVTGNCPPLVELLVLRKSPPDVPFDVLLERALAPIRAHDGQTSMLFSSEFLCRFDRDRLDIFRQRCRDLGYALEVVGYVRDIAGHALSDYSQRVKRHGMTDSFTEYLSPEGTVTYTPGMREWVEGLHDVLGASATTVYRYDSVRDNLVDHFFQEQLGITLGAADDAVTRIINRSLTPSEVVLMRAVNQRLRRRSGSKVASDALIVHPPLESGRPFISSADLDLLAARFSDEVDWINDHGLHEGPLLLAPPNLEVRESPAERELTPDEETLVRMVAELADRTVELRRRFARQQAKAPGLPRRVRRRVRRLLRRA
jgi:hypothetical protein